MKIIKWIGVMGIILVFLIKPRYFSKHGMVWIMKWKPIIQRAPIWNLKDNVILSVCNRDGEISLDIYS